MESANDHKYSLIAVGAIARKRNKSIKVSDFDSRVHCSVSTGHLKSLQTNLADRT